MYTALILNCFRFTLFFFRVIVINALCMVKKKYNVWSTKTEGIQVSVQLQLSSDNDFGM